MSQASNSLAQQPTPERVLCQHCDRVVFTGEVVKTRVINPFTGMGKCTWCREWTPVPVTFKPR